MKVTTNRGTLLPALATVGGVVERRQTLAILGNVLIAIQDGTMELRATDLELEVATRIAVDSDEEGTLTLPARKLLDICRTLPEATGIQVRVGGERATIEAGRSRFQLGTLPAADFPKMTVGDAQVRLRISRQVLGRVLDKTAFAMAQQDVRYYLNGVLLEVRGSSVIAVATDGHRLAKATTAVEAGGVEGVLEGPMEGIQIILPAKTVQELRRLCNSGDGDLDIEIAERTIQIKAGPTVVTSKLVDGRYPEYERVIPKGLERRAVINRDELKAALQRTAILSTEKYKGVRVGFEPGTLTMAFQNQEKEAAEDALDVQYDGEPMSIGFNVGYILDVLGVISVPEVEVRFRDGESSAVWSGLDVEDETFVIMPMRL